MKNDYDFYRGTDIVLPIKPTKPRMSSTPTAVDARTYADALEAYEKDIAVYENDFRVYKTLKQARVELFKEELFADTNLTRNKFEVIYSRAWDKGHSCGLQEVENCFNDLCDFIQQVETTGVN
jgi:hypothetical protein